MEYARNRINLTALFFVFGIASTSSASWSLEVIYPDSEVKNFKPPTQENFKIPLPRSSWKCELQSEQRNVVEFEGKGHTVAQRLLRCELKDKAMVSQVACGELRSSAVVVNYVVDGSKVTSLRVICIFE